MIAKLMGVTYLKSKLHRSSSSSSTSTNNGPIESTTTSSSLHHTKESSSRSKSPTSSSRKLKQKRRSNSHESVTRAQLRRSNTVPSGIALKNFSNNSTSRALTSLPSSPNLSNGLSLIEELPPTAAPIRNSTLFVNNNYNLTSNSNSAINLMSLSNGYLTVDYTGKDDTSSLYTGNNSTRFDDYYDSDANDDNDSVEDLWVLPKSHNHFSIPRTQSSKKKNVRFI